MYQLQILFGKQGNWENTVFLPMDKMTALNVMAMHNQLWSKEHCYRIIPVSWFSPFFINTLHRTVMNTTDAQVLRDMFTDAQWDAISSAMKDYADYGDEEATIADEIDAKIYSIFRVTEWYFRQGYSWGFLLISAPTVLDSFADNVLGCSC